MVKKDQEKRRKERRAPLRRTHFAAHDKKSKDASQVGTKICGLRCIFRGSEKAKFLISSYQWKTGPRADPERIHRGVTDTNTENLEFGILIAEQEHQAILLTCHESVRAAATNAEPRQRHYDQVRRFSRIPSWTCAQDPGRRRALIAG